MSNSKQKIKSNLSGFWRLAKAKMDAADTSTLNQAKSYVNNAISQIHTFRQEYYSSFNLLPTPGEEKVLYFVPQSPASEVATNVCDEYIWITPDGVTPHYEKIGSTQYTPDHSVEDYDDDQHLKITIGNTSYIIPRTELITPPMPTYTPDETLFDGFDGTTQITLLCESGGQSLADAEIFYTTDGSTPTKNSTKYTSPIELAQDTSMQTKTYTIKAIAILNGVSSDVMTEDIVIYRKVAGVSPSTAGGTYSANQSITLTCPTDGATIRYTLNGDDPTGSSTEYTGAIQITSTDVVLKARAFKADWVHSDVKTDTYILKVSQPTINAGGDKYSTSRTVTISKPANAEKLLYKKNGDSGWSETTNDTATINLSTTGTHTITAKGTKTNWTESSEKSLDVQVGALYTHAGLSAASAASNVSLAELTVLESSNEKKPNPAGTYAFTNNSGSDKYIWFAVPSDRSIKEVLAGAVPQDVEEPQTVGNYKFYRMSGALINGKSIVLNVTV